MAIAIPEPAKDLIRSGKLAHTVTVNADGSPQMSVVWIGLDGDELVTAHMGAWQKVKTLQRDPRIVISMEADSRDKVGMQHTLLIHGTTRITTGGAAQLLYDLGKIYVGPDAEFRPSEDPDAGFIVHIAVDRIGGIGPWNPSPMSD